MTEIFPSYFPTVTDKQKVVLASRALGLKKAGVLGDLLISESAYGERIKRIGWVTGATTLLEKVTDAIGTGEIPLSDLTANLDYTRLNRLTGIQHEIYEALTNPDYYGLSKKQIAEKIERTETAFNRLAGRVYHHLGTTDRLQTVVFRLGFEAKQ